MSQTDVVDAIVVRIDRIRPEDPDIPCPLTEVGDLIAVFEKLVLVIERMGGNPLGVARCHGIIRFLQIDLPLQSLLVPSPSAKKVPTSVEEPGIVVSDPFDEPVDVLPNECAEAPPLAKQIMFEEPELVK